jgi:hypothetical protein
LLGLGKYENLPIPPQIGIVAGFGFVGVIEVAHIFLDLFCRSKSIRESWWESTIGEGEERIDVKED